MVLLLLLLAWWIIINRKLLLSLLIIPGLIRTSIPVLMFMGHSLFVAGSCRRCWSRFIQLHFGRREYIYSTLGFVLSSVIITTTTIQWLWRGTSLPVHGVTPRQRKVQTKGSEQRVLGTCQEHAAVVAWIVVVPWTPRSHWSHAVEEVVHGWWWSLVTREQTRTTVTAQHRFRSERGRGHQTLRDRWRW